MAHEQTISLTVQPVPLVFRDIVANLRWLLPLFAVVLVWTFGSSFLFQWLESKQKLDWFDSFYFTVINLTTVGFGDFVPKSQAGKWLAMANSVFGVLAFGSLVAIITLALQPITLALQPSNSAANGVIGHPDGTPNAPPADSSSSSSAVVPETYEQGAYIHPSLVVSPKASITEGSIRVVYDGGEWAEGKPWKGWSVVELEWEGGPAVGMRWNGGGNSIGNPQSHGIPTWFIIPEPVAQEVLTLLGEGRKSE